MNSLVTPVARIVAVAVVFTCLLLSVAPVSAQENSQAPVVLDGHQLFELSPLGKETAQQRATEANRILQKTVSTTESPVQVEIEQGKNFTIITIKGRELLSVTPEDTPQRRNPARQAQIWAGKLEKAIEQAQYERTMGYFLRSILLAMGTMLGAMALSWGLGWLWHRWIQPQLHPGETSALANSQTHLGEEIGAQLLLSLLRGAILLSALAYISNLFPQTRQVSHNFASTLVNSLTSELFALGEQSYSVLDLFILMGLFAGLLLVASTVRKVLRFRVLSITGLSRPAQETIAAIANYAFFFIGTIVVLQLWGLDISSLAVFAGVLGVGIGLGIQGIAKEFVSGLVLIFERPIQVGDFVEVGELVGTVERISVRSTEISTVDQVSVILPNSNFLESEVINWSHGSPVSRLKVPLSVAYGSNLTNVRGALLDAAHEHPDVLSAPPPNVFFMEFGDSSLDFNLLVWICEPRKQFQIKSDLYFQIEQNFRARGVEIPFPQRDLHVRSGNLPVDLSPQLVDSLTQLSDNLASWLQYQSRGAGEQRGRGAEERRGRGESRSND